MRDKITAAGDKPLAGRRVLVTRPREQAARLVGLLEAAGAAAPICPLIALAPAADPAPLDRALDGLTDTDLLILTSGNAVDFLLRRLADRGLDRGALAQLTLVAVGPKTAAALERFGLAPDLVPEDYHAEGVVALLRNHGVAGKRILYPRADLARDVIPRQLSALGATVNAPVAYRNICPEQSGPQLKAELTAGLDAITLTSSSTLTNLLALLGNDTAAVAGIPLFSIGPQTSQTIRAAGLPVAAEADPSTLEGIAAAVLEYFQTETTRSTPAPSSGAAEKE